MCRPRRTLVLWLAGLSLVAVVAAAIFGRQQIVERWYIYRLESDDTESVDYAATRLAEMKSARAIVPLIEQLPREAERGRRIVDVGWSLRFSGEPPILYWTDSAVLKALYDLGDSARVAIERRRERNSPSKALGFLNAVSGMLKDGNPLRYSKDRRAHAA